MIAVGLSSGVLPAWFVLPLSLAVMCIVAASISTAWRRVTPASRRRIRLANGWVMLAIIPMAAAGFSLIDTDANPRLFVQVWVLVIGLLSLSIGLAILDMINTARLARIAHRRLRLSTRLTLPLAGRKPDATLRMTNHAGGDDPDRGGADAD